MRFAFSFLDKSISNKATVLHNLYSCSKKRHDIRLIVKYALRSQSKWTASFSGNRCDWQWCRSIAAPGTALSNPPLQLKCSIRFRISWLLCCSRAGSVVAVLEWIRGIGIVFSSQNQTKSWQLFLSRCVELCADTGHLGVPGWAAEILGSGKREDCHHQDLKSVWKNENQVIATKKRITKKIPLKKSWKPCKEDCELCLRCNLSFFLTSRLEHFTAGFVLQPDVIVLAGVTNRGNTRSRS